MVALTVVFESDVQGPQSQRTCQAWEQGLEFLLAAADLEVPLTAVFLQKISGEEEAMSADGLKEQRETLVRKLKQLELFEIPAVTSDPAVQQALSKSDLTFIKCISAAQLHQLYEDSAYIISV